MSENQTTENIKEEKSSPKKRAIVSTVLLSVACVFLIVVIILNLFVFVKFTVSGESMENTLYSGDVLFYCKTKSPSKGDVIVVDRGEYWVIKRLIAEDGDVVKISDGKLFVNDMENPIIEDYACGELYTDVYSRSYEEKIWQVGEDEVFYLGDNRSVSVDCRAYGCVKKSDVLGVVGGYAIATKGIRTFFASIFGGCSGTVG